MSEHAMRMAMGSDTLYQVYLVHLGEPQSSIQVKGHNLGHYHACTSDLCTITLPALPESTGKS